MNTELTSRKTGATSQGQTPLRILMVEDSDNDALLALRALSRHGYDPTYVRVETRDEFLKTLDTGAWDLVLADYSLPQFCGLDVPGLLRAHDADLPVIVMSGVMSEDVVVTAIKAGADDYIMKDNLVRLGPAVDRLIAARATRRIHEQTIQEHRLLSAAIHQAAEAIMVTDEKGTVRYVNPAFEKISGYMHEEAVGRRCSIVKSGKHGPDFYRDLWETISRGDTWRGHFINRRKDGTLYEEDAVISPVLDGSGKIVNYVAVKRDVTQEVLLEKQLVESQKMDAIGRLAGGLAHDFTNMLVVILSSAQAARRMLTEGSPVSVHLDTIIETARRSGRLTGDLLSFAQQQEVAEREMDLNMIIDRIRTMVQRSMGANVRLAVEPCPGAVTVRADPEQIEQAIVHLAVRARDAMAKGGQLTIATSRRSLTADERRQLLIPTSKHDNRATDFALLTVTDTGAGMSEDEAAHAFEPFFASPGRVQKTGLALPTVYGIVKRHGGIVSVYSRPNLGTTFTIYLPTHTAVTPEPEPAKPQSLPRGDETLLLVEDQPVVRQLLCKMLQQCGYNVLEADDATQALALADQHAARVAMLVTDVAMGSINGKELSVTLLNRHPQIKTIFVSGYPRLHLVHEGVLSAEDTLIQKPFSVETVSTAVRAVLDRQPAPYVCS